ncbi:MAG: TRAP transporter permease [Eubacteriales bacterium]|nr:TRAP transporter permease [Eubacteriales bacterium]
MRIKITKSLAFAWVAYQIFLVISPGVLSLLGQRVVHLGFALLLVWCIKPFHFKKENTSLQSIETIALIALTLGIVTYLIVNSTRLELTPWGYTWLDKVVSILGIIFILEATRRILGKTMVIVALVFFSYGLFGNLIPGTFGHSGYSLTELSSKLFLTYDGVFGVVLGVSTSLIFIYLIFGSFLNVMGGGKFFTDISFALFGSTRGGPAKMAVVSSCLFGSISGSAIANVVTTGTITIPLMKKIGYKPAFAGAVEAVASTGGQYMPPIMGATAFIMAQMMGVEYVTVIKAAFVSAILYYFALILMVDFEAGRTGMKGIDKDELPKIRKVMADGWHYMIPFSLMIYLLVVLKWQPQIAGLYSIISIVVLELMRKPNLKTIKNIVVSLEEGARSAVMVAIPCATIGIVVGVVLNTGIGMQFSSLMRSMAGGNLFPILLMTMITSLVLGLGVPTTAAYILVAIIAAPSLVELGVPLMAAHLFCFYFAVISVITPPVALAAYTAAGIAKADPNETGWIATKLGIAGFLVPFMFVYQPGLLLMDDALGIFIAILSSTIGIAALSGALQNYFFGSINRIERSLLLISSLCLIFAGLFTDLIGYSGFLIIVVSQVRKYRVRTKNQIIIEVNNNTISIREDIK